MLGKKLWMEVITKVDAEMVQKEEILATTTQEIPITTLEAIMTTTTIGGVVMVMLTEVVEPGATIQQAQVDHLQMVVAAMILVDPQEVPLAQVVLGGQVLLMVLVDQEGMDLDLSTQLSLVLIEFSPSL